LTISERDQTILDKIRDTDEPSIVFRAQDVFSYQVLGFYLDQLRANQEIVGQAFIDAVTDRYLEFGVWQQQHPTSVKIPDL
jgi:hypothetical protein